VGGSRRPVPVVVAPTARAVAHRRRLATAGPTVPRKLPRSTPVSLSSDSSACKVLVDQRVAGRCVLPRQMRSH